MEENTLSVSFKELELDISSLVKNRGSEWIVFLHGIQSGKELFSDLLKQSFLQKYSLLAIDLVGFGDSSKPDNFSYDIADQAKIIEQIVQILEIKKLHVIGHSMGGTVGTHMLQSLQDKIVSFINLEGNLTLADSSVTKEISVHSFEEFKKVNYDEFKEKVKKSGEASAELRSKCLEMIPDYAFYKTSQSIIKWATNDDLLDLFASATCKRLFVFGDKNAFKKDIAPDSAKKVEIPNAGHFMLIDNPQATYEAIENFLNYSV